MFGKKKKRTGSEVNSSSMADIAFLLLIFFLVATRVAGEKGMPFILPEKPKDNVILDIQERNLFKILINSSDRMLVEDEPMELGALRPAAKKFITNRKKDPNSSDSPTAAIISFRTDRGTSYDMYLKVLDELNRAYHELWAEHLGISEEELLRLDPMDPEDQQLILKAREAYPKQISEAEPVQ